MEQEENGEVSDVGVVTGKGRREGTSALEQEGEEEQVRYVNRSEVTMKQ